MADYWFVNLQQWRIEVFRDPKPDGYATELEFESGDIVRPLAFPGVELSVADLLSP